MRPSKLGKEPGELLFWVGILLLGICTFFFVVLPAARERRETASYLQQLEEESARWRERRERLELRREALERDPGEVERALRDLGYTPEGQVRVTEGEPAEGR